MTSTPTHPRAARALIALAAVTTALLQAGVAQGAEPTPAPKAHYMAFSSCREGDEFAGEGDWLAEQEGTYPITGGAATSTCQEPGGALILTDKGAVDDSPGSGPTYLLMVPGVLEGGVIHGGMISPEGQAFIQVTKPGPAEYLAFCTELCKTWRNFEATVPAGTPGLSAAAQCTESKGSGFCSTSATNAELQINSSTLLIKNEATPEAAAVGGSLTESPASGNADVTFTAHESYGTGIYRVSVLIDGTQVYSATPDMNSGFCEPHGTYDGALLFHTSHPCPAETPVRAEVPTSAILDGPHVVEVDLEDAAGNKQTVFSKTIQIQNHPATTTPNATQAPVLAPPERGPCNGTPCSEAAKLTAIAGEHTSVTKALKHSALTLTGRLTTPTGGPIKNAQVKLLQQIAGSSTTTQVATATTAADGAWSLKAPAGPSRLLRVAFYSHTLDAVTAATLDFHESVPAIVSIHAPRHVRLGQFFTFSGQLTGGYIPPGGEEVQVQIKYGGKWRELELVNANSKGKWKYRYAFTLEPGTKWAFRAIAVRNGAYPFTSHESATIHVAVRR